MSFAKSVKYLRASHQESLTERGNGKLIRTGKCENSSPSHCSEGSERKEIVLEIRNIISADNKAAQAGSCRDNMD